MGTTLSHNLIGETLFGKTRRALLGLLFGQPDESFHLRQLVRLTGAGLGAVQRELAALTEANILRRERRGVHTLYRANRDSPVFDELQSLVIKTVGVAAELRATLEPLRARIHAAWLFGSQARGEAHAQSDVDLLVISDALTLRELVQALRPVERRLAQEVNPVLYTRAEYARRRREGNPFITRIRNEQHITLIGDGDESA